MRKYALAIVLFSCTLGACSQSVFYTPQAELAPTAAFKGLFLPTAIPPVLKVEENTDLQSYLSEVSLNNKNLKSLRATVRAATFGAQIVTAQSQPSLDASISGQREKISKDLKPANTVGVGLSVKWAVDIWGRLSAENAAALLQTQQLEFEYQNARRVLLAQAMQTWLSFWSIRRQEFIFNQRVENSLTLLGITRDAYQNSDSSYDDLVQKRTAVNLLQEQQVHLRAQKKTVLHQLNILRGQLPGASLQVMRQTLLPVITVLPRQIPATVLAQRPDILAAFRQIEILDAKTRTAHKALLPQLNLNASLTKSSSSLGDALGADLLWQLAGGLTQPIFNGGQLRNQARQKSKEAESSLHKYEQVVLNAMGEVENALIRETSLAEQMNFTNQRLNDMNNNYRSIEDSYRDGTATVEGYLNAREQLLITENEWIVVQEKYLSNRISLALAIGQSLETKGN